MLEKKKHRRHMLKVSNIGREYHYEETDSDHLSSRAELYALEGSYKETYFNLIEKMNFLSLFNNRIDCLIIKLSKERLANSRLRL